MSRDWCALLGCFFPPPLSTEINMTPTPFPQTWQNDSLALDANTTSLFRPLMPPLISQTINVVLVVNLVVTMASLGSTMELSKIKVRSLASQNALL